MRVDYALRQHAQWYKGDGVYGDGPAFHWDYYNSFVIQPMLLDVLRLLSSTAPDWCRRCRGWPASVMPALPTSPHIRFGRLRP